MNTIGGQSSDEDALKAAMDASGIIGTWDWQPGLKLIRYDFGAAELMVGDADLAGQYISDAIVWDSVHENDRTWMQEKVHYALQAGGVFVAEYRVVSQHSGVRWVLSRGRIFLDPVGRPIRGRGILIDVTETRDGGHGFSTVPKHTIDVLDDAVDHAIAVHKSLRDGEQPLLRRLIEAFLFEAGREIAKDISH